MGIFSDIMDVVRDAQGGANRAGKGVEDYFRGNAATGGLMARAAAQKAGDDGRFFSRAFDSVARKARQSVLLFPVVVSDGISAPTAAMLGKALQVRSAEYVRLAISNMDAASVQGGTEKTKLIAQIRGDSLKTALFGDPAKTEAANRYLAANLQEAVDAAAAPPPRLAPPIGRLTESEADEDGDEGDGEVDYDSPQFAGDAPRRRRPGGEMEDADGNARARAAAALNAPRGDDRGGERAAGEIGKYSLAPGFDKVNQFTPVTLELTFNYRPVDKDGNAGDLETAKLLLAVKSQVHPVPGADLVDSLGKSLQRDSMFLQFLRLTSGEISLVSDFFLGLSVAKARAAPTTGQANRVLEALRKQAEWNQRRATWLMGALTKRGFVPPTATIVITADEASRIRQKYNVDFQKPDNVRKLLQSHNLMGFGIADEALAYVKLFEDGDDDFDRVPFSELASRGKETSVKDLMTILARN